jgi:hypothetical protein
MEMKNALVLAKQYIEDQLIPPAGDRYVVVESAIKEVEGGWYFPYQTARFIETRDINFSIVGNWPIFVSRSGEVRGPTRPDL